LVSRSFIAIRVLIHSCVALKAFPAIYKWTTRPVTLLLEHIWNQEKKLREIKRDPYSCSPYVLELVRALERSLAFAVGGNAKVLSKRLMNPLWLARGIIETGFPSLNPDIFESFPLPYLHDKIEIVKSKWPLDRSLAHPAIISKASHIYNYSQEHYVVSNLWPSDIIKFEAAQSGRSMMSRRWAFKTCASTTLHFPHFIYSPIRETILLTFTMREWRRH
jgi:hypothetical protein